MILSPSHKLSHLPLEFTANQTVIQTNAVSNTISYDVFIPYQLAATESITFAVGTFHTVSYRIINGTGTISINGNVVNLKEGDSSILPYPALNTQSVVLTSVTGEISILLNKSA